MKSKVNQLSFLSVLIAVLILLNMNLTGCKKDSTETTLDNLPNITGYPIVGTNQTKHYDNSTEISESATGSAFYGQNAIYSGNEPKYVNNSDSTITDMVTGLMWQQTEDSNGDGTINFYDKLTDSEALAGAATCKTGGHTDWRLPTIKELYSLAMFNGFESGPGQTTCTKFIDKTYFSVGDGDVNALSVGQMCTVQDVSEAILKSITLPDIHKMGMDITMPMLFRGML
jgi:Protein of unknown function (DUF1566)